MGALKVATYATNEHGDVVWFQPGEEVPDWAASQFDIPDAWVGDVAPAVEADQGDTQGALPYEKWRKDDLVAEVERRNEGRDEDDVVEVEGKGTVADLAAALLADDAAQAS